MKMLFLMMLVGSAQAQAVFTLDAQLSKATFTLPSTLHTVHGSFKVKRGSIRFDPSTGTVAGKIVVDATSGESGNEDRDKKMHRTVLESQKFPEITFVPSRLHGTVNTSGDSKVEIEGTFSIHGASHPVTASVVVTALGDRLEAKVVFSIPYVSWGMKSPSTLFLHAAESVEIDLEASGKIVWSR